ncbi:hypothetical protein F4604DRAFT_1926119 [Suillus subluteus]|nr:hypothetical protein F4604DRAFT_1926119 [Suillus subluteus]
MVSFNFGILVYLTRIPRVITAIGGQASVELLSVGLLSQGFELPKMQRHVFEWLANGKGEIAFLLLLRLTLANYDDSKKTDPFHADLDLVAPITGVAALHSPNSRHSTPEADDSILTMDNPIPCSCATLTLQTIQTTAGHWRKNWESEDTWNVMYEEVLTHAQAEGEQETTRFLDECAKHAWDGREQLKYDTILLYDLLVSITSQVKFFEVKVDSFCP